MAIASWVMWGGRSLRSNRPLRRARQDTEDYCFELDLTKGFKENLTECLFNVCQVDGVSSSKKLASLNAIVKLINESNTFEYGFSKDELFCCLRVGLVHKATQVRAATLRAVRYFLQKEQDVIVLNRLQYPYFIARSVDVNIRNEVERLQALRLVRKILLLAPKQFSFALARSIICITSGGMEEKDRASRVFLAIVCELGVLNPYVFINCGGVSALARASTTGLSPAISEASIGVLLRLLGDPETRSDISLLCLAAPYCELESIGLDSTKEDWDQRFAASKYALLSVLRSYSGLLHFCHPHENSGLKAIADILYVEQLQVRGAVLELLYELLGLPLPEWTDEPDVALAAIDPNRVRSSWKLSENFVAAEGRTILPSLMSHCPNITEIHQALLINILLECGIHKALAKTIISSDTFISVRAAVLLGAILHLAHSLLPSELCDLTPPLPILLEQASLGCHQALAAVAILSRMHSMMRRRPTPASLFMDRLLQGGNWLRLSSSRVLRRQTTVRTWLKRDSLLDKLLRESQVLSAKDAHSWDWFTIRSIIRSRDDTFRTLQDTEHRTFIKRLIKFFKPTSNQFSRIDLATCARMARDATLAGCDLINFLLESQEPDATRFLHELLIDIAEQIMAIRIAETAHDALLSPRLVTTTCCQKYFLFLGQLSHSPHGTLVLRNFNFLDKLLDLAIATKHDCYVKLVVSSLDYSREGPNRRVFSKIIQDATLESTRMYATQFLRILFRTRVNDVRFWAFGLLLQRLNDESRMVALTALEALHEACEEPEFIEVMMRKSEDKYLNNWDEWLNHLGDRGHLLKIRLYSLRSAFSTMPAVSEELERWIRPGGQAERYAGLIECEIHDSLTRRQRDENGCYLRRMSGTPHSPKDVYIPPHLIGQLVQHDLGLQLLLRRNILQRFSRVVQRFRIESGGSQGKDNYGFRDDGKEDRRSDIEGSNRLETIIDSEGENTTLEVKGTPQKNDHIFEMRRKLSQDDSIRTTPEKSSRNDNDREEYMHGLDARILKVKSALWALGHAGTSNLGVEQLISLNIIELMTTMAESCPHYSVRATAMYALSLISTTRAGAEILAAHGWPCVRHSRAEHWPVVQPISGSFTLNRSPSPVPMQRNQRSLSDSKSELPESVAALRRQRNRSESAAADLEPPKRYPLPNRAETPSPLSSVQKLSQQDAEGYAKLKSLQKHRRPSFSHSSLEQISDGRLSLQSLSECDSNRSLLTDPTFELSASPKHATTKQRKVSTTQEEGDDTRPRYRGISLPIKLSVIFPEATPTDVMLEKINRVRPSQELRAAQSASTSDSSILQDELFRTPTRTLRDDAKQNDSGSDYVSTNPMILEEFAKANDGDNEGAAVPEASTNNSNFDSNNRLAVPNSRQQNNSISDIDEESCSEYEQPSDHSRLCLVCFRERSASGDICTVEHDFRRTIDKNRRDVLKHAQRLSNPVYYRQSRQYLLRLRQQYPEVFQDACVYSEVAARLANNTYRLQARRFLQELFLDSSFPLLYEEPLTILKSVVDASEQNQASGVKKSPASSEDSLPHHLVVEATVETKVNGKTIGKLDEKNVESLADMPLELLQADVMRLDEGDACGIDEKNSNSDSSDSTEGKFTYNKTQLRTTDEMIISEILKPEERLKSKATDKIPKSGGIKTAFSLE
ncbi:rapamycin-insensitive companion of mTOR [Trichogramma pretiosum]|uniref:rapamycin-insensitive companion of mTOR n=1 Tax=Trichogramma pretiosum TaxID=7493 RepID=UPI0006C968B8|nr:rapamycin-insensitive companion of mTOR [Trichogramma pretiosum]